GSSPAKVFFKDGRYVNITAHTANTRNGNFITGNISTQTVTNEGTHLGDYLPSTDTTGRSIGWSDDGTTQTITLTDVNGQSKTYRIAWTTLSVTNNSHPCVSMTNAQFRVVSS